MERQYVKKDFAVTTWDGLQPYFTELEQRPISSAGQFEKWLRDYSELGAVVSEDMAWRYIRMTCDTASAQLRERYNDFVQNIEPRMAPVTNALNKKIMSVPFRDQLTAEGYRIYLRSIQNSIDLFREENIPLNTQLQELEQQFGAINGEQSIEYRGEKMTLQKAGIYLKDLDRNVRKEVFVKIQDRRALDEDQLNDLFTELVKLRHQVARNAGFENFRDYKHQALARFDYSVQDCLDFHEAVRQHAVPLLNAHDEQRRRKLGLDHYRPWDTSVDEDGKPPLKPFKDARELVDKTIACFNRLDPYFGDCVRTMEKMGRLDLESRLGKAPGGYQYPLYETEVPFIFMNSVGLHRDLVTMVHEGGHAVHSFLDADLEIVEFKSPPSEVAELASMSMELLSMEHWDEFFDKPEDLVRAKRQQLEGVMDTLPWIACIDKFQHWVYLNPEHTIEERYKAWRKIVDDFGSRVVNYIGFEDSLNRRWQVQLHLYEVPFYYIEYGFAQLGAVAVWRNYKKDPQKAIADYKKALALGYTRSIPEIYAAANIRFDFSPAYIKELMDFVKGEYEKLG